MFWGLFTSALPVHREWDSRDTPWFWELLRSQHAVCVNILEDFTLRDGEGNPPPKDMWLDKKELDQWRKDREEERKRDRNI